MFTPGISRQALPWTPRWPFINVINIRHLLIGFFRCIFALCEAFAEHARKADLTGTPERQEYGQRLKELAAVTRRSLPISDFALLIPSVLGQSSSLEKTT